MVDRTNDPSSTTNPYFGKTLEYNSASTLKTVIFDEGVKHIGDYAFYNSNATQRIENVTWPSTLESIGSTAFAGRLAIKEMEPFENLKEIGSSGLSGWAGEQEKVVFSEIFPKIEKIGNYGLSSWTNVSELVVDNLDVELGDYALSGWTNLRFITLPIDYNYKVYGASTSKRKIESIHYLAGKTGVMQDRGTNKNDTTLPYFEYTLEYTSASTLKAVTFDEGVKHIGNYAFYYQSTPIAVLLPESVESFGQYSFRSNAMFYGYKDSYSEDYVVNTIKGTFIPLKVFVSGLESELVRGQTRQLGSRIYSDVNGYVEGVWTLKGNLSSETYIDENNRLVIATNEHSKELILTCTFEDEVKEFICELKNLEGYTEIHIYKVPNKARYELGEMLDLTGGEIVIVLEDGTTEIVSLTDATVLGYDSSILGTQVLDVYYLGHKTTLIVNVVEQLIIFGDVNNDGKINGEDRLILTRTLAGWEEYPIESIDMEAADVNQDGKVNTLDRRILSRYLAGWAGYETLPY